MSNYATIVHDTHLTGTVDSWLARWADVDDVLTAALGRRRLVIISRSAATSTSGALFFRGTAVSPEHNVMVFGVEGWRAAPAALRAEPGSASGEYVVASWSAGRLSLDRDIFGSVRTAYTSGPGFLAASDSLVVLISLRRELGLRNRVHREVATARTARNAVAGQQISADTIVREIRYLPAGRGLRQGSRLSWEPTGSPIAATLSRFTVDDHREGTRAAAASISRTVRALTTVRGWHPRLSLSGGQDSRLVLAAARSAGVEQRLTITTAPRSITTAADYDIVMQLISRYDLPTTPATKFAPAQDPGAALTLWGASLLGFYDGFGPGRVTRSLPSTFEITGIGAEIYKGNWGWTTIGDLARKASAPGDVRDALLRQLNRGARAAKASPSSKSASELLYLAFRNGIHGAAGHIGIHMTGVTPIMQLQFAAAAHTRTAEGFAGSPAGITDMTLLLAPEIAVAPHADPTKDISKAEAESRLRALGGPLGDAGALEVLGSPDDVVDGPSGLSMNISRALGFHGAISVENALDHADESVAAVSDRKLRALYVDLLSNARWRLEKTGGDFRAVQMQLARLRALDIMRIIDG